MYGIFSDYKSIYCYFRYQNSHDIHWQMQCLKTFYHPLISSKINDTENIIFEFSEFSFSHTCKMQMHYICIYVLCRQRIKLFQVVSTSEFHEYKWNNIVFIFLSPRVSAGPQKPQTLTASKSKYEKFGQIF